MTDEELKKCIDDAKVARDKRTDEENEKYCDELEAGGHVCAGGTSKEYTDIIE